jgi:hypothetical protein
MTDDFVQCPACEAYNLPTTLTCWQCEQALGQTPTTPTPQPPQPPTAKPGLSDLMGGLRRVAGRVLVQFQHRDE